MSQLKCDLTEFVLDNRNEINHYLNETTSHLGVSEHLFEESPEVYDSLLSDFKRYKLIEFLSQHFNCDLESLYLIIDSEFIKILYI